MEHLTKKVGVWMDYSMAHLMEFSKDQLEIKTIDSKFTQEQKISSDQNGKYLLYNRKEKKANYFKKILNSITNYDEVVLFGPYETKKEFFNLIELDNRFQNSKVLLKQMDKMTLGQQKKAFVRGYYAK